MPDPDLPATGRVALRLWPLIEARPAELVVPVASLLLAKIQDGPFFTISDHLRGDRQLQSRFQQAHGAAFEDYAHGLIQRVSMACGFEFAPSPTPGQAELSDAYSQRGSTGVAFELKALRVPTVFLVGGSGDRVLGPPTDVVNRIEDGHPPTTAEGARLDEGLLTKGLWQGTKHGPALVAFARDSFGTEPDRIFPLLVYLARFHVGLPTRATYLDPVCAAANLLSDPWWRAPQWLHVEDLESLVGLTDSGHDLETILVLKETGSPAGRFDLFLYESFGTRSTDPRLNEGAMTLLENAAKELFDEEIGGRAGPPSA